MMRKSEPAISGMGRDEIGTSCAPVSPGESSSYSMGTPACGGWVGPLVSRSDGTLHMFALGGKVLPFIYLGWLVLTGDWRG